MDPEIIPDGLYDLKVFTIETRTSQATGRQYYAVTWEIESPPYEGQYLFQALLDSDKASWVWKDVVVHPLDLILDTDVTAEVRQEEYQGKRRNQVGKLHPRVS